MPEVTQVFIYALCAPGTRTIRYIGKAQDPQFRLNWHCRKTRKHQTHLGAWLRSLGDKRPALLLLKKVSVDEWQEWERRYIRCAKAIGFGLVNGTEGGDGIGNPSPEARENMSRSHRGKTHSEETRSRMRDAKLMNSPWKGKRLSLEHRIRLSESHKGKRNSPEAIAKMVAKNTGSKRTPEQCARMKAAQQSRREKEKRAS